MESKNRFWWASTVLTIMCLYWLSNVVLWMPWRYSPQLGMVMMLTVNPVFWGVGLYSCLACEGGARSLVKKAMLVSLVAVGISLISDFLFFAVYMGSKEVWHITTFCGYAWLVILVFAEAFLLRKRLITKQCVATRKYLLILAGCLLCLWILQLLFVCNFK